MEPKFFTPNKKEEAEGLFESLKKIEGLEVRRGINERDTYELIAETEKSITTAFITVQDHDNNADISFKSIRTLPKPGFLVRDVRNKGEASALVQKVIRWGDSQGFTTIIAIAVQLPEARDFWQKNNFVYRENPDNAFEEWIYKP